MAIVSSIGNCKTTLSTLSSFTAHMDTSEMRKYCEELYTTLVENFGAIDDENALHDYLTSATYQDLRGVIRYLYSTLRCVHASNSGDEVHLYWL